MSRALLSLENAKCAGVGSIGFKQSDPSYLNYHSNLKMAGVWQRMLPPPTPAPPADITKGSQCSFLVRRRHELINLFSTPSSNQL